MLSQPIKLFLFTTCLVILTAGFVAGQSKVITERALGVSFTPPDGWLYEKSGGGYVFGHNSIAGMMVISASDYKTLDEMRAAAMTGINEGGVSLMLSGELKPFGNQGLKGFYTGAMNGQQVKVYAIGMLHPLGGPGIDCMILTTTEAFGEVHVQTLNRLAKSVEFFKPETPAIVKEWDDYFKQQGGCRLHHLTSSGSSDYGGGYTGSSDEAIIDLCPNGAFGYSANSGISTDFDAGFAYSHSKDGGQGQWSLSFNGVNPVLHLKFHDGREMAFEITYIDNKTYLNGTRYFLLTGKDGPGCY